MVRKVATSDGIFNKVSCHNSCLAFRDRRSPVVKTDNMTCMEEFAFFCLLGSSKNIIKSTKFRSFITNNIEKGTRGVSSAEAVQCLSE